MRVPLCTAMVACACVPVMLAATGSAGADTQVALPNAHGQFTTRDGVSVQVDRNDEHATVSASIAANPLSRNVWVSGVTSVDVAAPDGVKVTGGRIETGYLVGCQVDLGSGAHANASGDAADQSKGQGAGNSDDSDSASSPGGGGDNGNGGGDSNGGRGGGLTVGDSDSGASLGGSGVSPYSDPNMSLQLKPGKVATKQIETYTFTGSSGTTQYVDHTLAIDGCAGYAEARSYMTIVVHDNVMDATQTLWGQPFSIG